MRKVGEILRTKREEQGKSLQEISEETKVRVEYLDHIEQGEYNKLPDKVYVRGFISTYAAALGLQPDQILPFYRRELQEDDGRDAKELPKHVEKRSIHITPNQVFLSVLAVVVIAFIAFLYIQFQQYAGVPVLIVDFPPKDTQTSLETVEISGKTDSDVRVTVNGQDASVLDDGSFRISYDLRSGVNRIRIVAKNLLGKEQVVERVIERLAEENADAVTD